jgi:hypothetical protein
VQCRIAGYDYAAVGNSTSKKDAQSNAARDMVQYLVRTGDMQQSEVPDSGASLQVIHVYLFSMFIISCFCFYAGQFLHGIDISSCKLLNVNP